MLHLVHRVMVSGPVASVATTKTLHHRNFFVVEVFYGRELLEMEMETSCSGMLERN